MGKNLQWLIIATVGHIVHNSRNGMAISVSRRVRAISTSYQRLSPCRLAVYTRAHLIRKTSSAVHDRCRSLHNNCLYLSHISSTDSLSYETDRDSVQNRINALHGELSKLGIDADELGSAVIRSMSSTDGYDIKYGKSAIRAYRSFVYPRSKTLEQDEDSENPMPPRVREDIHVGASRFARQIDFLAKRHRSHVTEWVRHTDTNATSATRFPLLLVLDNLRSAFNVGSIFRTADACGVCLVITTGITPHPHGNGADKVSKAALGADTVVPSLHFTTTKQGLEYLRQFYPQVAHVALETTSRSRPYTDISYPGGMNSSNTLVHHFNSQNFLREEEKQVFCEPGTALILGNEVSGVDTELLESMDFIVEIPMYGVKNSLNVASCAPVVLYEILRQWDI